MKTFKVILENYELAEIIISKENKLEVISYLYELKVPEECIVSIEEVSN